VVMAGARTLIPTGNDLRQASVHGPIVIGADTRLGAGHTPDDPGPGGWLLVDQEASAIAPPGLLVRTAALKACQFPALAGDALWIDLCAQLRANGTGSNGTGSNGTSKGGGRLVWTPDVSFISAPEVVQPDGAGHFRTGTAAAKAVSWADPYHHPGLSLHGDLLTTESRTGLIRAVPADKNSLLVSGDPVAGGSVLNAARALRRAGMAEADWVPELPGAADLGRRAATGWVRINPLLAPHPHSPPYTAVYTTPPEQEAIPALAAASQVFATSPGLVTQLRRLGTPGQSIALWRPALSPRIWQELTFGTGLNTKPRVLWFDEGIAPSWLVDLINETLDCASWIVVERKGANYAGAVARIAPQDSEFAWAQAMSELGPQIMVRPAANITHADHYPVLLAAAAGCRIFTDDRMDTPPGLGAVALPSRASTWIEALKSAIADLKTTLEQGRAARAAALALPGLETSPPPWLPFTAAADSAALKNAALQNAAE